MSSTKKSNTTAASGTAATADGGEQGFKIPVVSAKQQPRKHKVIQFGYTVTVEGEVPDLYRFQYPPNLSNPEELFPGIVPAGFTASVEVEDMVLYLHTRQGNFGPEFQVCYGTMDNPVADWSSNIDALWMETLAVIEEYGTASEDALEFLDADPHFLFGIADPSTQKALEKAAAVPVLKCLGQKPVLEEWFEYLNADRDTEKRYMWVVESFAEVELPAPWTSFKGVGSIVCYLNNETNETTWKHPFYEYFAQLLDHCRKATAEEHIKLRINRMLWTYEADCAADLAHQQPLISPKYVMLMADVLDIDVKTEPFLVATLKTFLKAFSQQYRLEEDLDLQEIKWCMEIVENERQKADIAGRMAQKEEVDEDQARAIDPLVHAQVYCVDCGNLGTVYCTDCQDALCDDCYERLHEKGNRKNHNRNTLLPCNLCQVYPAKLQCTYTFGTFCHECYARKHVKTLPKFLDLKPTKIDYRKSNRGTDAKKEPQKLDLGKDWRSFYDMRGTRYYYNFKTGESMRGGTTEASTERDMVTLERYLTSLSQDVNPKQMKYFAKKMDDLNLSNTSFKSPVKRKPTRVDPDTPSTAAPSSPMK